MDVNATDPLAREAAAIAREFALDRMLMSALGAVRVAEDALVALAAEPHYVRRQEIDQKAKARICELLECAPPQPRRLVAVPEVAEAQAFERATGQGRR